MANTASLPSSPGPAGLFTADELAGLEIPLRRYVLSRTRDPHQADDIVQETLTRTLAVADSLEIETLSAYAIVVARNEITARARADTTARRHLPRLLETRQPVTPDEVITAQESRAALASALAALPDRTRLLLIAHDVHGQPLTEIAQEKNVRPGALAAQLHRTRARLRVDYVLALRRATLPTTRCRPVLLAISAGDFRQQHALNAGEHLAGCAVCDDLAVPLLTRDRSLAGLMSWLALGTPHGVIEGWARGHPRTSATTATAAAAAAVLGTTLLIAAHRTPAVDASPPSLGAPSIAATTTPAVGGAPSTAPSSPTSSGSPAAVPNLTAGGAVVPARAQLGSAASAPVVATAVVVLAVPGDEGFWVGDDQARMWVQMTGRGESPLQVTAGMRMSFQGNLVVNGPTFVSDLDLKQAQDRAALDAIGIHIEVASSAITVVR